MDYRHIKDQFKGLYRPLRYNRRGRLPWYLRIKTLIIVMMLLLMLFYAPSILWGSLRLLLKARDVAVGTKRFLQGDDHTLGNIARIANIAVVTMVILYFIQKVIGKRRK